MLAHSPHNRADTLMSSIVIVVRGTASVSDAVTDASASVCEFDGVPAHCGIARAAVSVFREVQPMLQEAIAMAAAAEGKPFRPVVVGHSLGAGTAILLTVLLRQLCPDVTCVAFAPPPMVAETAVDRLRLDDCVTAVVLDNDLVPRSSLHAAQAVVEYARGISWKEELSKRLSESEAAHIIAAAGESRAFKATCRYTSAGHARVSSRAAAAMSSSTGQKMKAALAAIDERAIATQRKITAVSGQLETLIPPSYTPHSQTLTVFCVIFDCRAHCPPPNRPDASAPRCSRR